MSTQDTALVLSGRYRLEERIGSGGAGAVWRATDTVLDRSVAVKLLHRELEGEGEASRRFRREATAAAAITHPNAVVIYDIGEDDGRAYLVMELITGPALVDVLDGTALRHDLTAAIGHQVAGALGAAHRRGLAHRDVKPANILLTTTGAAKVADFGIAKALGEATAQLTATGKVMGTAAYLAPEQLEGSEVDQRADVYALGLVLFQCLTGRSPFDGATTAEVAAKRLVHDAPRPRQFEPSVPTALDDVVARATRRDPAERYEDGAELAAALAPFVPEEPSRLIAELSSWRPDREATRALTVHDAAAVPTQAIVADTPSPGAEPEAPTDPDATQAMPGAIPAAGAAAVAAGDATTDQHTVPRDRHDTAEVPRVAPRADRADVAPSEPVTTPRRDRATPAAAAAGATAAGAPATARPSDDTGSRKKRTAVWASVGVVALAALATGVGAGNGGDPNGGGGGDQPASTAIRIAGASDFDPLGGGSEHPEAVARAYDGDAQSYWTTERYDSAAFGGLKPGVGIWFDLGAPSSVQQLQMLLDTPGIDVSVYASNDAITDAILQTEPVATSAGLPADATIDLGGTEGRYFLVWITNVPSGVARINEVEFDQAS